jgi:hypothetical protein
MSHKLTPKQVKAAYLLASGNSGVEIATALNMRRETLSQWKRIPKFNELIEQIVKEQRDIMRRRITEMVEMSIANIITELSTRTHQERCLNASLGVLKMIGIERLVSGNEVVLHQMNSVLNSARNISSSVSIDTSTPSACSDVTPKLLIPQGTIPA